MALIKCSECGKRISSEATSCPHCGAPARPQTAASSAEGSRGAKKRPAGRAAWLFAALMLLTVVGALMSQRDGSGRSSGASTSAAADPSCNVRKADGSASGRECDLRELCADAAFYDRKVAEAASRGDAAASAKASASLLQTLGWLGEYRPEDVAAYCSPQAVSRAALGSATSPAQPAAAGPVSGDGSCGTPLLEVFQVGLVYSPRELERHVATHCPGALLGADGVLSVKSQGKPVAVEFLRVTPELLQVRAIRSME
jgi:zinc-ribbon domain